MSTFGVSLSKALTNELVLKSSYGIQYVLSIVYHMIPRDPAILQFVSSLRFASHSMLCISRVDLELGAHKKRKRPASKALRENFA